MGQGEAPFSRGLQRPAIWLARGRCQGAVGAVPEASWLQPASVWTSSTRPWRGERLTTRLQRHFHTTSRRDFRCRASFREEEFRCPNAAIGRNQTGRLDRLRNTKRLCAFSLAQFDNLAQKTRLSRLVVQRNSGVPARPIGRNQTGRLDRLRNTKRSCALQSCPV